MHSCGRLLPSTPLYEIDVKADDHSWASYELQPGDAEDWPAREDQFVGITPFIDISKATFAAQPFQSERFSRFGETFCYLKLDGIDGLDAEHFGDRGDVEDAIDDVLVPAKLGRTIGGGTGRRYSYIDLALTDVEQAAPLIAERLRRGNIARRTWLLFHEPELRDEWIGMYDDTPPPPAPPPDEA
jgi:hypothetical protein